MDYSKYLNIPNAQIPNEINLKIINSKDITPVPFCDINSILESKKLQNEIGCLRLDDGTYLVSMICPMPKVTKEMVQWWFWWHPQENVRYQLWYPGEHISISYSKKNLKYFSMPDVPPFEENTQYPVEKIGFMKLPLAISFKTPENFGFSKDKMEKNGVSIIVCGDVGLGKGLVYHTKMSHIFFERENGLFMVSRFWLGENLKSRLLRKLFINKKTAVDMAKHCCVEYRNFAKKIPLLYNELNKNSNT